MDRLSPVWAVKAIIVIVFSSILFRRVSATNHSVGGTTGWDLASDMQSWSSATTFHTGDNLVFVYGPTHDLLEVNQRAYNTCQTSSPISTHNDGKTVIPLDEAGTRYFICGTSGHCGSGLKVQVDVLPTTAKRPRPRKTPPPSPSPLLQNPHPPALKAPPSDHKFPDSFAPRHSVSRVHHHHIAGLLYPLPLIIMIFL